MREKLSSLIKIHLITILMTACSTGGNCILGAAYTSAVFEGRLAGWVGLGISEAVMFFLGDPVLFTKYTGVLAVMAAFTLITRAMRAGKVDGQGRPEGRYPEGKSRGKKERGNRTLTAAGPRADGAWGDVQARSLYAGIGMTLLELTGSLFSVVSLQKIGVALWYGIACGILTTLFAKGLRALLAGEASFEKQRSENMISAACFLAAVAYAVIRAGFLPDFALQGLICLLLLYMGHACGPAMGAVTGAAVGMVLSFSCAEISYLGILCFLGLLCGMFRELGRFAETIAFFAGAAGMMFCGVPFLTELQWLTGVLTAGGIWIFWDMLLTFRERSREKRSEAECAGTFPGCRQKSTAWGSEKGGEGRADLVCADVSEARDNRMAEMLMEFAQEVQNPIGKEEELYSYFEMCRSGGIQRYRQETCGQGQQSDRREKEEKESGLIRESEERIRANSEIAGRFWAEKYMETRDTLAVWMSETGEILKSRHVLGNAFVKPEEELTGLLKKRLAECGIQMHEVWRKQNPDGQTEIRFLWSAGNGGPRKQSRPVMVKDVLPVLDDLFGMAFEAVSENRSLVGREQSIYEFVQVPNFKILHGSATTKKCEEDGNGDTFGVARIGTTQVLFGIADGVGSGRDAADGAAHTLEQLEQLLRSGVSEETSLRLIDSMEIIKDGQGAALDFGVINLNTGICHLLKAGGAPGFLLRGTWVEMLDARTLPLGLLPGVHYEQKVKKLYDGDVILLVSDGVFQAFPGENRAEKIGNYLAEISELGPRELARCLLDRALSFGKAADDMSVLAIGVYEA